MLGLAFLCFLVWHGYSYYLDTVYAKAYREPIIG